jgi:hypothetical protein
VANSYALVARAKKKQSSSKWTLRSTVFTSTSSAAFTRTGAKVENGAQAGIHHLLTDFLCRARRGRNDADVDRTLGNDLSNPFRILDQQSGRCCVADATWIRVEDADDKEISTRETGVVAKGVSEITGADDEQAPLAVEAEDLDNILTEFTHVVANSPYAELAEVREVLSDLGRVEVEPLCQLLAGDVR